MYKKGPVHFGCPVSEQSDGPHVDTRRSTDIVYHSSRFDEFRERLGALATVSGKLGGIASGMGCYPSRKRALVVAGILI